MSTRKEHVLGVVPLDLDTFMGVVRGTCRISLGNDARSRMEQCVEFRRKLAASDRTIYGVNTGFGKLADTVIAPARQAELQRNLLRSHAVGWGPALSCLEVRGMILLRAASLAHGFSGARPAVVEQLLWLLESEVTPWIPSRGSVGASGDLAPLAHLALVLMGEGHVLDKEGHPEPAAAVLLQWDREPLRLEAKEGLALINGTQLMNSLGLLALDRGQHLVEAATIAAMLSLEALEGSAHPLGEAYQRLRPHGGICDVAAACRTLLSGSGILEAHRGCSRVQDPYSVRCLAQVLGSSLDVLRHACEVLVLEADSVTDNPVLLPEQGEVITGGHFHGQPLAHQLDFIYQSLSEVANISERRINLMLGGNGGRLPRFLARRPGLESGLMIAQYLAAALVSENKNKAFPAAVDSIPTSDGQEDHVSMGSVGALKLSALLDRCQAVIGLEMLTAARALQFLSRDDLAAELHHKPKTTSPALAAILEELAQIADLDPGDRPLTHDLNRVVAWIDQSVWPAETKACLGSLAVEHYPRNGA